MKVIIQPKLFICIFSSFILFTIIGTVSHELGHYAVARYYGYDASINYKSTHWVNEETMDYLQNISRTYRKQILAKQDFPEKEKYFALSNKISADSFLISWGGPLQTMLTGTIGVILLIFAAHKIRETGKLATRHWIYIFLALFWLRQTANLVVGIGILLLTGSTPYSDEIGLAYDLNFPAWSISFFTAMIGLGVLGYVVLKIVPANIRFTFLTAGLFGGIIGYLLWLELLGPIIMP